MSKRAVPPELSEYFAKIGKKGGKVGGSARAANMSAAERSESARKAVQARWAKRQKKPLEYHSDPRLSQAGRGNTAQLMV